MDTIWPAPIFEDPEDKAGSDPKAGGMDEIGTDKDDEADEAAD